jgi:hypothetical protein
VASAFRTMSRRILAVTVSTNLAVAILGVMTLELGTQNAMWPVPPGDEPSLKS